MFPTGVRLLSRKTDPRPLQTLLGLLQDHGPQTIDDCWKIAEPIGIKSKTRMKAMLYWLVEKKQVQIKCLHAKEKADPKGSKELLFSLPLKQVIGRDEPAATKGGSEASGAANKLE